ncbi:MAG TPA: flavin reductase family protein [Nocardioides sp.]|nr:flavin reductase family protein [Nocardioides sp.]
MTATQLDDASTLSDRVRRVHAQFPTGVMVVTTAVDGVPHGLAVNAFSSVSLDPPVVLFCVAKTSRTHAHLYGAEWAAVNILSHRQLGVAKQFATSGVDKFAGLDWTPGPHGAPVLDGASAWLEVELRLKIDASTHTIFTGQVHEATSAQLPPLVYLAPGLFDGARLTEATLDLEESR